eukprot:CAMPEP_0196571068 /NCGR_PEP_ID=MMETSP1081-20130531/1236_1 /TAXON_ID=36882 /ORGANISM="Pyramimonas amylifera, Strain CCMP720" /LENGTH=176 /DNA_ID=CAMNT_0041887831 /DNA_START=42 /DNA_END=572 /DNA_ORIENTATION=-
MRCLTQAVLVQLLCPNANVLSPETSDVLIIFMNKYHNAMQIQSNPQPLTSLDELNPNEPSRVASNFIFRGRRNAVFQSQDVLNDLHQVCTRNGHHTKDYIGDVGQLNQTDAISSQVVDSHTGNVTQEHNNRRNNSIFNHDIVNQFSTPLHMKRQVVIVDGEEMDEEEYMLQVLESF